MQVQASDCDPPHCGWLSCSINCQGHVMCRILVRTKTCFLLMPPKVQHRLQVSLSLPTMLPFGSVQRLVQQVTLEEMHVCTASTTHWLQSSGMTTCIPPWSFRNSYHSLLVCADTPGASIGGQWWHHCSYWDKCRHAGATELCNHSQRFSQCFHPASKFTQLTT